MRLLLDAHLPSALARELRRRGVDAAALPEWQEGSYRTAADAEILAAAHSEGRVFVSYDCQTIPPLLMEWAEAGEHHAGVVLVDGRTFRPNDVGGLLRALRQLVAARGGEGWEDRVIYLS